VERRRPPITAPPNTHAEVCAISFATEVKSELAGLLGARPCCQRSELRGIFHASHGRLVREADGAALAFPLLRNPLARKVVRTARQLGSAEPRVRPVRRAREFCFTVEVRLPAQLEREVAAPPALLPARTCDRKALLRGFFLGCGSVNAPSARYHLELVAPSREWAGALAALLQEHDVHAGVTDRAGQPLVYVKDGDGVAATLSLLGASRAVMAFENARVVREVSAQVNRRLNFETANLDKTAGSSSRQLAAIRRLEESGRLDRLPGALREIARLRLDHPEQNLDELARRLRLSKSGINHRLRRLMAAAAADTWETRL
jgi:cell division protein WhiA